MFDHGTKPRRRRGGLCSRVYPCPPATHLCLEWRSLIKSSVQECPTQPCPGAGKAGGAWATLSFQRLPKPKNNCHCQGTSPSLVSPAGRNELLVWELSVPFRSEILGEVLVGRILGGPEPQVMFKAVLSAKPAQVTPILTLVSSQRRSHPKAAQLPWEKLFPYGQWELSLLQLLHGVTCPSPEHPAGLWALPRGTRKPLGNL